MTNGSSDLHGTCAVHRLVVLRRCLAVRELRPELLRTIADNLQNRLLLADGSALVMTVVVLVGAAQGSLRGSIRRCQVVARHERLCASNVFRLNFAAFEAQIQAFMQIVLPIVFDSRATAALQTVQLLESLVCLLVDAQKPSNTALNAFVSVGEDDRRAEIRQQHKEHRQQRDVGLLDDVLLAVDQ